MIFSIANPVLVDSQSVLRRNTSFRQMPTTSDVPPEPDPKSPVVVPIIDLGLKE